VAASITALRLDRLGDVVLALPVWQALKERFREYRINAVVTEYTAPLLENLWYIDEVCSLRNLKAGELTRAKNWLQMTDCRSAVVLQPSWIPALIPYSAAVPVRVGFANRMQGLLANRWVYQRRSRSGQHEVDLNLAMLAPLGIHRRRMIPRLKLSSDEIDSARERIKRLLGSSYRSPVVIHPGSGGSSLGWSKNRFLELARILSRVTTVIVSGKDREELEPFANNLRTPIFAGSKLREFISLLALSAVLVSVDTGPMHIAAALGVPTVSIFSPLVSTSPERWGPRGNRAILLTPAGGKCSQCLAQNCLRYPCTDEISPREVANAVKFILSNKG
jgi:ADP-heptose:LPS heptosyltransferase